VVFEAANPNRLPGCSSVKLGSAISMAEASGASLTSELYGGGTAYGRINMSNNIN
jgi:hypothetical protein